MKLNRKPHPTKAVHGNDAWWYEGDKQIEVYVSAANGPVLACQIERRHLLSWLKRTEPK